jgi:hypothetical protein
MWISIVCTWLGLAFAQDYTSEVSPFMSKPFEGEYACSGVYDHDPSGTGDQRMLTAWDTVTWGKSGHDGWDWPMKVGTPILSVGDGEVFYAGTKHIACKGIGKTAATSARVKHTAPSGEVYIVGYLHLSKVMVEVGDKITRGQQIGTSGSSGCSSGPHLHLAVEHVTDLKKMKGKKVDPFGWQGDRPDPRFDDNGNRSAYLWRDGEAPLVYKTIGGSTAPSGKGPKISFMSGMGWRDDVYPNQEWVEIALGAQTPRDAMVLTGMTLGNRSGQTYVFPAGFTLHKDRPVRVYSGTGKDTDSTLFWGNESGVWDDATDCAHLTSPKGAAGDSMHWGRKKEGLCAEFGGPAAKE